MSNSTAIFKYVYGFCIGSSVNTSTFRTFVGTKPLSNKVPYISNIVRFLPFAIDQQNNRDNKIISTDRFNVEIVKVCAARFTLQPSIVGIATNMVDGYQSPPRFLKDHLNYELHHPWFPGTEFRIYFKEYDLHLDNVHPAVEWALKSVNEYGYFHSALSHEIEDNIHFFAGVYYKISQ